MYVKITYTVSDNQLLSSTYIWGYNLIMSKSLRGCHEPLLTITDMHDSLACFVNIHHYARNKDVTHTQTFAWSVKALHTCIY
jgi:hypothetical protein